MNILEMNNISKSYFGVKALDKVSLKLEKGSVHALIGENGAGKSTLMKILSGNIKQDEGDIILNGKKVNFHSPLQAVKNGISMIYQELTPIKQMTVCENVFLGREPTKFGLINYNKMYEDTEKILHNLDIKVDPRIKMFQLKVSEMQLIEIAKAISYDADIIIMDEPTSAITEKETKKLFTVIKDLQKMGKSIIYISHKMSEITEICDTVTIFRDGKYIDTSPIKKITMNQIISLMVGRELNNIYYKTKHPIGNVLLSVNNITCKDVFKNISFELRKGEIVGIAGLMGSGRTEVMEAIFGMRKIDSGEILVEGKDVNILEPLDAINNGIGFITEDRKEQGLVLTSSIKENITISSLKMMMKNIVIDKKKEDIAVEKSIRDLNLKCNNKEQIVSSLSGGNQQKVVISRWLLTAPKILIMDEPTRGIDIGAKSEIYKIMDEFAKNGFGIIMISSELPEVLSMSDKILVFREGTIKAEIKREDATQEIIMSYATS